jgi:Tfp pilus assembly protein PilV
LWKLSARAASPRFAIIEVLILVLFLVLAIVAIVSCFAELSHLLQSDAVGRVAAMAINGSV